VHEQEHAVQRRDMLHHQQAGSRDEAGEEGTPAGRQRITRRELLVGAGAGAVALGGALALGGHMGISGAAASAAATLPPPTSSGIEHVVLLMMENRSFDHFLGWLPGANGRQAGLSYPDPSGAEHSTYPLAPDYQGCSHPDPDHSYSGGRIQYDGGRCDGWLLDTASDQFAIGYYTQKDLAFLGQAAPNWTVCDNYYPAILGPTYPNRIYQHAAQTDRLDNSTTTSTLPTIWDRLAANGISGRYYYSDVPFLALWGAKYLPISYPIATFFADCAAGTLPAVSYVDPRFIDENSGTSGDDHPHADIRNGEAFLNRMYTAVMQSPAWSSTVFIVNFDEWGGFFDHVPPSTAPIPPATQAAGDTDGRRGFRVPALIIAPWSRRGAVSSALFDHTSVLRLIEWRWGLPALTIRDATANNLASALDFRHPSATAPRFDVPVGPFGGACPLGSPGATSTTDEEWTALQAVARQSGWPV
jgi:phospholipase C